MKGMKLMVECEHCEEEMDATEMTLTRYVSDTGRVSYGLDCPKCYCGYEVSSHKASVLVHFCKEGQE